MQSQINGKRKFDYKWIIALMSCLGLFVGVGFCSSAKNIFIAPITSAMGFSRSAFTLSDTFRYATTAITTMFLDKLIRRFGGEASKLQIKDVSQRQKEERAEKNIKTTGMLLQGAEQRKKGEEEHKGNARAHQNVGRGMYAEIHTGYGHQHAEKDGKDANDLLLLPSGHRAEGAHGVLAVTRGEGVARGFLSCAFHNGKARVLYPRTGNTAEDLKKLAGEHSRKAYGEKVVALVFVKTPKEEKGQDHDDGFFSQPRDEIHQGGEKRGSNAFKPVQNRHKSSVSLREGRATPLRKHKFFFLPRPIISQMGGKSNCFLFSPYRVPHYSIKFRKNQSKWENRLDKRAKITFFEN